MYIKDFEKYVIELYKAQRGYKMWTRYGDDILVILEDNLEEVKHF